MYSRAILTLVFLVLVACGGSEPDGKGRIGGEGQARAHRGPGEGTEAVGVMAYRVQQEPISTYILANTTLEAIREVTAYAKLNAIVEDISVEEGDAVSSGQGLLRLEDREIRNEHLQARIAVDQARLLLEQAKVRAQQMEASYQRALSLFQEQLTSQQDFDQAVLNNRTEELVSQNAEQQYQAAQARLEAAEIQLDYTQIGSPIAGVITTRLVDAGDRVTVNQAVFTVADLSVLWARIYLPEKTLPQIHTGQRARIEIETYPEYPAEGVVKMISPGVDPASGTFKATLEVRERGRLFRPGMFGTVRIATETHTEALVIPKKAVLRERDQHRVFVIDSEQTVEKRTVALGFGDQDRVEVVNGLALGEAVVTVGYEGLGDGYPVSVVGWEGPSQGVTPGEGAEETPLSVHSDPLVPPAFAEESGPAGPPGFSSPEGVEQLEKRLLSNPAIREEYESRLVKDPSLSTDADKKRAFLREMMQRVRRSPGAQ